MNKILSYIAVLLISVFSFTSCSSDDNSTKEVELEGSNDIIFNFEHKMYGQELEYGQTYKANGNSEEINVTFLKYIISNFQLTDNKGKVFTYTKNDSYFIIDSETNDMQIVLKNVPAGRYTKVKFGVGVDQEKYLRGQEEQQDFWDLCAKHDLIWGWITGYKFINFQGEYENSGDRGGFSFHIGSHGSKLDNYKSRELASKETIEVSNKKSPIVTVGVEVSKLLDSTHKIVLKEKAVIMVDAVKAPQIMDNALTMFEIEKVE
ncbi:MbnP family protein [Myroides injenensis]|uniref:MbnP family protein n=1 Tax=Myroides injenensis TaxID=1183151 RepID=UPI000288F98F|nr:MbnP family protein [Myroides injenensis]